MPCCDWIADSAAYYQATSGDPLQAEQRLTPVIKDALRFEFNARTLQELIAGGRKDITERVRQQANDFALRQSEFKIKPVSAAGGTIKVKDELKFSFEIVAVK